MHNASDLVRTMKRRIILLLVTLLCTTIPIGRHASAEDVSVVSYNIRYLNNTDGEDVWPNRRDAVVEVVASADVACVQECVLKQLQYLERGTPTYQWYGVGRDDGQLAGEMTAIGWKTDRLKKIRAGTFWLSPTPDKVSKGWDADLERIASWVELQSVETGSRLLVVNTHFDHRGAKARLESAKQLRKWVGQQDKRLPLVLAGDFNATPSAAPVQAIVAEANPAAGPALMDARTIAVKPDSGPESTWNGFKEIVAGQRIDHIFVKGGVKVTRFQTLDPRTEDDRFASDHLPVQAWLSIGQ